MSTSEDQPQAVEAAGAGTMPAALSAAPMPAGAVYERTDWLAFGITSTVALLVYLCTMAPEVTLENSGMMVTAAAYGGVPHIPGYPVWTLWSWLFTKLLPFSNDAWRVGVASAVSAALASGLAALLVSRGGKLMLERNAVFGEQNLKVQNFLRVGAGCAAGIGLGLSAAVWPQAVVAETWTFGLFLFASILCLSLRWLSAPARRRFLYGAIYIYGTLLTGNQELLLAAPGLLTLILIGEPRLGRDVYLFFAIPVVIGCLSAKLNVYSLFKTYTTHNAPLVIVFGAVVFPVIWVIWRTRRAGTCTGGVIACTLFLLLGLAWYFYLPIASMANPPMNWGYPRTVDGFLHAISRGQMQAADPVTHLAAYAVQCGTLFGRTCEGLGGYYLLFAILPFCIIHRMPPLMRKWMAGMFAVFLCVGPLMLATLNPAPERAGWDLITPYFSPLHMVLAIWAGWGLQLFANCVVRISPPKNT